jgi:hypothetical protein
MPEKYGAVLDRCVNYTLKSCSKNDNKMKKKNINLFEAVVVP